MRLSKNTFTAALLMFFLLNFLVVSAEDKREGKRIKILTYNVKFLPNFLAHIKHFPVRRAPLIAEALLKDSLDIIVYQEMFDARARRILEKKMKHDFPYMIGPRANKPKGWKRGSGVMVMSKYPLKPLEKTVYSKCKKVDCVARKGVMAVEVDFNGQPLQLFGTHMQAGGGKELKKLQHKEFGEVLKRHEKQGVPQISLGDFNTHKEDPDMYGNLLRELQSEDGDLIGELQYTSDHTINDMDEPNDKKSVIDYVLYKGNGVKLKSAKRQVRAYTKRWSKRNKDLSDHFAVLANFEF